MSDPYPEHESMAEIERERRQMLNDMRRANDGGAQ
jgi:hypothetical protein